MFSEKDFPLFPVMLDKFDRFFVVACLDGSSGAQIINDNMMYAKVVVRMGVRTECKNCDFSDILEDEDVRTNASIVLSTCAHVRSLQEASQPLCFWRRPRIPACRA